MEESSPLVASARTLATMLVTPLCVVSLSFQAALMRPLVAEMYVRAAQE